MLDMPPGVAGPHPGWCALVCAGVLRLSDSQVVGAMWPGVAGMRFTHPAHACPHAGLVDPEGFDDFRVVIGESGLRPNKG